MAIGMVRQPTRECGRDGAAHGLWMDGGAVHNGGAGRIEAEKADRRVTELGPDASIGCKVVSGEIIGAEIGPRGTSDAGPELKPIQGLLSSDWRADFGPNDFTGDNQLHAAILLPACGGIV
jgi:hypothetical protein